MKKLGRLLLQHLQLVHCREEFAGSGAHALHQRRFDGIQMPVQLLQHAVGIGIGIGSIIISISMSSSSSSIISSLAEHRSQGCWRLEVEVA